MATIEHDIAAYERWLRKQCRVVEGDLVTKHERMRDSPFAFLRGSYFRWAATIEKVCRDLRDAPRTLCVGDSHVENFGTWRDGQSRLAWGVNDFDEAATMPYAYDLVRLAASARLAPGLQVDRRAVAASILQGYAKALDEPRPLLLDERAHWLRSIVDGKASAARKFWQEVDQYPDASPPSAVRRALRDSLPDGSEILRFASRTKGLGSLGRPRFVVIANWRGGRLVREAKALVPSAWHWAHPESRSKSRFLELACGPYRAPDPELAVKGGYVYRRIAPDAHKVELPDVSGAGLGERLLAAMGADLAAIHAVRSREQILRHLKACPSNWLHSAALAAERSTRDDFESIGGR
jgi:hypothetical protein